MNIIIVGYGRVGASLASLLGASNSVSVVDNDPEAISKVDQEFIGRAVLGVGYDEDALIKAGIEECDALAVVTSSDNVNLMTSEVARQLFGVPHVIARLISPDRFGVYKQLGLDYVCDTEIVAEEIAAKIRSHRAHHLDTFGQYEIMSFALKTEEDMTVEQIESLGDIQVSLIEHEGVVTRAGRHALVSDGDTLLVVAHEDALDELSAYMKE